MASTKRKNVRLNKACDKQDKASYSYRWVVYQMYMTSKQPRTML